MYTKAKKSENKTERKETWRKEARKDSKQLGDTDRVKRTWETRDR